MLDFVSFCADEPLSVGPSTFDRFLLSLKQFFLYSPLWIALRSHICTWHRFCCFWSPLVKEVLESYKPALNAIRAGCWFASVSIATNVISMSGRVRSYNRSQKHVNRLCFTWSSINRIQLLNCRERMRARLWTAIQTLGDNVLLGVFTLWPGATDKMRWSERAITVTTLPNVRSNI